MYESFNDLTTVNKQHFVEWFCGNTLRTDTWGTTNVQGSGTFSMVNSVDGGFSVKAGTSNNDETELDFGGSGSEVRPYSHTGSVCIFVTKAIDSGNGYWTNNVGFTNTVGLGNDYACMQNQDSDPYFSLISKDTSFNRGNSSVSIDNDWHCFKLECTSTHLKLTIDGVLEVNKTANRPTAKLMPVFNVQTQAADDDGGEGHIRYMECYNT